MEDIEDELSIVQTHCYTCGKPLGDIRWQCPVCKELQCSEECRTKHIEIMDNI